MIAQTMIMMAAWMPEADVLKKLQAALTEYNQKVVTGAEITVHDKAFFAFNLWLTIMKIDPRSGDPMKAAASYSKMEEWMKLMPKEQ